MLKKSEKKLKQPKKNASELNKKDLLKKKDCDFWRSKGGSKKDSKKNFSELNRKD